MKFNKSLFVLFIFACIPLHVFAAPIAIDDLYEVGMYTTEVDNVLATLSPGILENDNGEGSFTAILVSPPMHQDSEFDFSDDFLSNGSFQYYPELNFSGVDHFTYKVFDGTNYSNVATVTINVIDPGQDIEAPEIPTGVTQIQNSATWTSFEWTASDDNFETVGYKIYRSTDATAYTLVGDVDAISFMDSNITSNTQYEYKIKSYDAANNESDFSSVYQVTTANTDSLIPVYYSGQPYLPISLGYSLKDTSGFATQFKISKEDNVKTIRTYLHGDSSATSLSYVLYSDDSGIPLTSSPLFIKQVLIPNELKNSSGWLEATNLNWNIVAGTYWLGVEVRDGDSFTGAIPFASYSHSTSTSYTSRYNYSPMSATQSMGLEIFTQAGYVAPVTLSNIKIDPLSTTTTLTFNSNINATSTIKYGLTSAYGSSTSSLNALTSHTVVLSNLTPSTTYHFQITVGDSVGTTATSSDQTFTTLAPPDTTAPILSEITSTPSQTSVSIKFNTNENASSTIAYGTTASYGSTTALLLNTKSHTFTLSSLTPSTTYHYKITTTDASNNTATSTDQTFTTTAESTPSTGGSPGGGGTTPKKDEFQLTCTPSETNIGYGSTVSLSITSKNKPSTYTIKWLGVSNTLQGFDQTKENQRFTVPNKTQTYRLTLEATTSEGDKAKAICPALKVDKDYDVVTNTQLPPFSQQVLPQTHLFTQTLRQDQEGSDAQHLQIYLNTHGYPVNTNNLPGAPGYESTYFGNRTVDALTKFQTDNALLPTGILDLQTRTFLNTQAPTQTLNTALPATLPELQALLLQLQTQLALLLQAHQLPLQTPSYTPTPSTYTFTRDLYADLEGPDVKALQIYLNTHGYIIAQSGPGAPGQESTYFGNLLQDALKKFQADHNISATGYFGVETRGVVR